LGKTSVAAIVRAAKAGTAASSQLT
jgi:hypothetical protein